ncbi:MAG: DUF4347 domain-containing protein [Pseudomonadota bacterium]
MTTRLHVYDKRVMPKNKKTGESLFGKQPGLFQVNGEALTGPVIITHAQESLHSIATNIVHIGRKFNGLTWLTISTHGFAGEVQLGKESLTEATVKRFGEDIKPAFATSKTCVIELMACSVAHSIYDYDNKKWIANGNRLCFALANATGAHVRASDVTQLENTGKPDDSKIVISDDGNWEGEVFEYHPGEKVRVSLGRDLKRSHRDGY